MRALFLSALGQAIPLLPNTMLPVMALGTRGHYYVNLEVRTASTTCSRDNTHGNHILSLTPNGLPWGETHTNKIIGTAFWGNPINPTWHLLALVLFGWLLKRPDPPKKKTKTKGSQPTKAQAACLRFVSTQLSTRGERAGTWA